VVCEVEEVAPDVGDEEVEPAVRPSTYRDRAALPERAVGESRPAASVASLEAAARRGCGRGGVLARLPLRPCRPSREPLTEEDVEVAVAVAVERASSPPPLDAGEVVLGPGRRFTLGRRRPKPRGIGRVGEPRSPAPARRRGTLEPGGVGGGAAGRRRAGGAPAAGGGRRPRRARRRLSAPIIPWASSQRWPLRRHAAPRGRRSIAPPRARPRKGRTRRSRRVASRRGKPRVGELLLEHSAAIRATGRARPPRDPRACRAQTYRDGSTRPAFDRRRAFRASATSRSAPGR
jgi:hypothetical protein